MSRFCRNSGFSALVISALACALPGARASTADFPLYAYDAAYCQYVEPVLWIGIPPTVFYDPCWMVPAPPPCVIEGATSPPPNYAAPTPAPPSPTGPAAPTKPAPKVSETRSFYDAAAPAAEPSRTGGESLAVGFWNLSDHDVTVIVNDQRYFLPPRQSVKVNVGRQFTWRVEGRDLERERIPDGVSAAEIVIRR
jgi:hypothetical protein